MQESDEHAVLTELFRRHPELAVEMVRGLPGVIIPEGCRACSVDPIIKTGSLVPDNIIELQDAGGVAHLTLILETQRDMKDAKRRVWPVYQWHERYRRGCDCFVVVVTTSRRIAAWAAEPIRCGESVTQVLVLGPGQVPRVTDPAQAREHPELAVLSASIYGTDPDGHLVVRAALAGLGGLPEHEARMYSHFITRTLTAAAIRKLSEDLMQHYDLPPWDFDDDGIPRDGYQVVIKPVVDRAIAEDRSKKVLRVLSSRGVDVDDGSRARILECEDVELLDVWFERSLTAASLGELFGD